MLNEIQQDAKARMTKSLASLENDFSKIRAGRAHPSLLEQIQVDYYGSMVPISQVANISAEDSRTLKVSPWEKEMVAVVEKAIMTSDLGLNPQTLGQVMRIPLPPLTEERRRELVRIVKDEAEQAKVAVRNIRRDANSDFKELLKDKERIFCTDIGDL
jgi:ribosome recycling factor